MPASPPMPQSPPPLAPPATRSALSPSAAAGGAAPVRSAATPSPQGCFRCCCRCRPLPLFSTSLFAWPEELTAELFCALQVSLALLLLAAEGFWRLWSPLARSTVVGAPDVSPDGGRVGAGGNVVSCCCCCCWSRGGCGGTSIIQRRESRHATRHGETERPRYSSGPGIGPVE